MKKADRKAQERYLRKIALARKSGDINPFETKEEQKARIERCKKDIKYMVEYYFPHYAKSECADFHVDWANRVKKNPEFIGFAKWGRGLAKSVWNNVFIPYWLWLNDEEVYFVLVGQNEKRATQLLQDIRVEFEANPRIIHDFGEQKKMGSWEEGFFATKGGFIGQAIGLGQSCRGLRVADLRPTFMSFDDLETRKTLKNPIIQNELVEWFEQEALPAMDGKYERAVISNNWFAPEMFLRKLSELHPDWYVHEVKAYDPATYEPIWKSKYKLDYYKKKEKKMGLTSAHAEYLHIAKIIGKIFKSDETEWIKLPRLDHFKVIVAHWDIAYAGNPKSDYNAVRIWGLYKNEFYYIDSFVRRTKMRPAVQWIADKQKELKEKNIKVIWRAESQFWNGEVKRTIADIEKKEKMQLKITIVDTPKTGKIKRIISGLEAPWQNRKMKYNVKKKTHPDTIIGLQQLYGIEPNCKVNDDAPDADEQCIAELEKYINYNPVKSKIRTGKVERKNVA